MVLEQTLSVTNEEVQPGPLPAWLLDHIRRQSFDSLPRSKGGPSRILVLYPGEEARRENLERLADEGLVIDRTLHHTMDSLEKSLLADLRMPRILSLSGGWNLLLNVACAQAAANLHFPILHPIPQFEWNRNKTRSLTALHSVLAREGRLEEWDGAGIDGFSRVLRDLENRLGGTHPDFVTGRVIDGLQRNLDSDSCPFSLSEVDGIVMLDHSPVLPSQRTDLLRTISQHRPIHQLVYPGNFRQGIHGFLLEDQYPIKESENLPDWLPLHEVADFSDGIETSNYRRFRLQRETHSIPLTTRLIAEQLGTNPASSILLIDPTSEEDTHQWIRALSDLGISLPNSHSMASSKPLGHWLSALAGVCHGPNAWSLDSLRALSLQGSLSLFSKLNAHPTHEEILPQASADLLSELARSDHILGGAGALERWLVTLAREEPDIHKGPTKEATQWWLLSLAQSNSPLLADFDRGALSNRDLWRGCHSGQHLPQLKAKSNGDEWLTAALSRVDLESGIESADGSNSLPAAVVQSLVDAHSRLRKMQLTTGQPISQGGVEWVVELETILSSTTVRSGGGNSRGKVRLTTPEGALGCTADLVILANVSSASWDLRVQKIPLLGDEERHRQGILRPDTPIRQARHHLYHLLSAANSEIVILDPSQDKSTPVAAPIREWIRENSPDSNSLILEESPGRENDSSNQRWQDGNSLRNVQAPSRVALNPSAVSIPLDVEIQEDRERRQPRRVDGEGYLLESATPHIWAIENSLLLRKSPKKSTSPRMASRWPVVGGPRRASIDPRPLSPEATGSAPFDSRHGHTAGAEQTVPIWSASRLKQWLSCPRRGWLTRGLYAEEEERQREDLDSRVQGNLLHKVHHQLIERILGVKENSERTLEQMRNSGLPLNIATASLSDIELHSMALEILADLAPWLERTDAVSNSRLRMLTGFSRDEWLDWLRDGGPTPLAGRIGRMVTAERTLRGAIPIAIEWEALSFDEDGIEISLPEELSSHGDGALPALRLRGEIDRVDLLPFDSEKSIFEDESGSTSVAPIRFKDGDWKPRRMIIIRDIKTSESEPLKRHRIGLLEELQLALYARAWEVAHPGDLVVAAGISVIGHNTDHFLEVSGIVPTYSPLLEIGDVSHQQTTNLHRFPDEEPEEASDSFRAWLAQRLTTALATAAGAASGRVHPTPSKDACKFCPVTSVCDVRYKGDDR